MPEAASRTVAGPHRSWTVALASLVLSAVGVVVALLSPGRDAARADVVPAVDVVPGAAELAGPRSPVR
jgi:hypothetical protein